MIFKISLRDKKFFSRIERISPHSSVRRDRLELFRIITQEDQQNAKRRDLLCPDTCRPAKAVLASYWHQNTITDWHCTGTTLASYWHLTGTTPASHWPLTSISTKATRLSRPMCAPVPHSQWLRKNAALSLTFWLPRSLDCSILGRSDAQRH